jgi:peptidoglycan LD-endopeptidase LytH
MWDLHTSRRTSGSSLTPLRVPSAALAFLLAVATSCERIEWVDAPRDADEAIQAQAGSAPTIGDSSAIMPIPPQVGTVPAEPTATPVTPETHLVATPLELASLSAILEVPVAGVPRSELRDTYTEARGDRAHEALDILAPLGTPVLSAVDGRLLKIFDSEAGGLMVYATDPSERFILLYGHLDGYADGLSEGMPLLRGQVIGYVGTTGNARIGTPHLHFGILRGDPDVSWWTGTAVNPYPLLVRAEPSQ